MKTITVAETKAHLSEILNSLENGEEIIITRRGRPVAKLTAITPAKKPLHSLAGLRKTMPESVTPGTVALSELRQEQR